MVQSPAPVLGCLLLILAATLRGFGGEKKKHILFENDLTTGWNCPKNSQITRNLRSEMKFTKETPTPSSNFAVPTSTPWEAVLMKLIHGPIALLSPPVRSSSLPLHQWSICSRYTRTGGIWNWFDVMRIILGSRRGKGGCFQLFNFPF